MKIKKIMQYTTICIALIFSFIAILADTHISPESTRVIFHGNNKFEMVKIQNNSLDEFYGLKTWTESSDPEDPENIIKDSANNKFIISPEFTIIPPGNKDVNLHITILPDIQLPEDRESLFYIDFQEVPQRTTVDKLTGKQQSVKNALQFAMRTKIKLIYRPKKIKEISNSEIEEKLSAIIYNDTIMVINSSAYVINAVNIYSQLSVKELLFIDITNEKYTGLMDTPVILKPFSNTVIPLEKNVHVNSGKKQLAYINDAGVINLLPIQVKKETQSFIFKSFFKGK